VGQAQLFFFSSSAARQKFFRAKPKRAGKKEGGWGEGIFARPLVLGGGWVCVAEGDAQVSQDFAQKRFALCPVIATKQDFHYFWEKMFARSPRLRLGSLRKFPYILGLNQMDGQNQKSIFCPAGGGSACEARNKMNILYPIFSFPPSAEHEASFCFPRFRLKAT